MIKKYCFNLEYETGSVVEKIEESKGLDLLRYERKDGSNVFSYHMSKDTAVFGLGETVRGINKRGWTYTSFNADDPNIMETRESLYASHNFIIIRENEKSFGCFFDLPSKITFDLGYSNIDEITITAESGLDLYMIENDSILSIISEFRKLIGKSYIPPVWAFGLCQSRWGYKSEKDILDVVESYEKNGLPLDSICMDIDVMDDYKDFTLNDSFKDPKKLNEDLKKKHIYLVPIVDAAVKKCDGYYLYEEMVKEKHYCADKDGNPYVVGVWPGDSLFPDYLNKEHAKWFGRSYKKFLDYGFEGFWNDMNEPVLFYSRNHVDEAYRFIGSQAGKNIPLSDYFRNKAMINGLQNNVNDYREFYHDIDGKKVSQYDVHNMFGYKMVECASDYFREYDPSKRYLLYSRSSMIGSHRYSGIWTGDNASWWNHILLNFKMLPSLNMCGYLYSGADTGGFGQNTTEDLLIRWTELSIFTPLFRNHSASDTRRQEYYLMKNIDIIRNILSIRYAILPYLYSEFIKAAEENKMLYTPLGFVFTEDERCREIEDELLFGESVLLAPIYTQNQKGRMVYLPEDMMEVRMRSAEDFTLAPLSKGDHYVKMDLDEVVFFIRKDRAIPIYPHFAKNVSDIDYSKLSWIRNNEKPYEYTLVAMDDTKTVYDKRMIEKNE